jgi:hypothetical protein
MTSEKRGSAADGSRSVPARAVGVFHVGDPSDGGIPILPPDPEGTVYRRLDTLQRPEDAGEH